MRKCPVKGQTHRLPLLLMLVQATRPFLRFDRNGGPQRGVLAGAATDEYPRHLTQLHHVFGAL